MQGFTPEQLLAMLFVNLKATGLPPNPLFRVVGGMMRAGGYAGV